jgi:hypothetical protein
MAITPVAYLTTSYSSNSAQTINFSGLLKISDNSAYTLAQDDFVVVCCLHSGTAARTLAQVSAADPTPAVYPININSSVITSSDTNYASMAASYKFMGATPDASVTVKPCESATASTLVAILVFTGVDQSTPLGGVTPTTATGFNGARPDNPSITTPSSPSGCVMVGFGGQASGLGTALTVPTTTPFDATARYTGVVSQTSATNNGSLGYGIKTGLGTSAAFNPSVWNGGQSTNTGSNASLSFILATAVTTQTLTPSLFTNSQTFYAPAVSATRSLTPSLFTNGQTFYTPTVTATRTLTPSLFTNSQAFYPATVSQGFLLQPALFTNGQSFYGPTVTPGPVALTPSLFTNAPTFYGPTVTQTTLLQPALVTNTQVFFSPSIVIDQTLLASLVANDSQFFPPTVTYDRAFLRNRRRRAKPIDYGMPIYRNIGR